MRAFRCVSIMAVGLMLSGCAVLEPRISVGPEDTGYCMPVNAGQSGQGGSVSYSLFEGRCPPGFERRFGGYRGFTGTADNFHHAIALLRDRRLEMERRDTELTRLDAGARLLAFGAVGTVLGGLALSGTRDLVTIASLAAGGAVAGTASFAPRTLREVLQAGIRALSCVESKAFSARIAPQVTQEDAQPARQAERKLAQAVADPAFANRPALPADTQRALANADDVLAGLGRALAATRAGQASGPLIANAVYERTLAIVNGVNAELMRSTPTIEAVMALARGSAGLAVDGLGDTAQQLNNTISRAREAQGQAGIRATSGTPAAPATPNLLSLGGQPAPEDGAARAAREAREAAEALGLASSRLADAAGDAATAGAELLSKVSAARSAGVAQISACAFEVAEGSAGLAFSPAGVIELPRNGSATVVISGGRGPYRVTRTGAETPITAGEFTLGPLNITARNATVGASSTFVVQDLGNPTVPPGTITARVGAEGAPARVQGAAMPAQPGPRGTQPNPAPPARIVPNRPADDAEARELALILIAKGATPAEQDVIFDRMRRAMQAERIPDKNFLDIVRNPARQAERARLLAQYRTLLAGGT